MRIFKRGLTVLLLGLLASFSFSVQAIVIPSTSNLKGMAFSDTNDLISYVIGKCIQTQAHDGNTNSSKMVSGAVISRGRLRIGGTNYYTGSCSGKSGGTSNSYVFYSTHASCPNGETYNSATKSCENKCEKFNGEITEPRTWDYFKYGSSPTICAGSCGLNVTGVSACMVGSGSCTGSFIYTGEACSDGDGMTSGGTVPDSVPAGCEMAYGQYYCPKDTDGDGKPNAGAEMDSAARCDYSGDKFVCHGGSYAKEDFEPTDPTKPVDDATTPPDITPPDNSPVEVNPAPNVDGSNSGDLSGVITAIQNQNKNMNSMMTDLNLDNNKNFSEILNRSDTSNQHLKNINDSIVESTNKSNENFDNTKALSLQSTKDIVTAINSAAEFDDSRNDKLVNAIEKVEEKMTITDNHIPSSRVDVPLAVFSSEDIAGIQTETETLKTELNTLVKSAKDIVKISDNFNDGTLSHEKITIKGTEIELGLWRFAGVAGSVSPVIIFICTLIAFFIIFNVRSK